MGRKRGQVEQQHRDTVFALANLIQCLGVVSALVTETLHTPPHVRRAWSERLKIIEDQALAHADELTDFASAYDDVDETAA